MTSALQVVTLYRCSMCGEMRPDSAFPPKARQCLECRTAYAQNRRRALAAGTWSPGPRGPRRGGRPSEPRHVERSVVAADLEPGSQPALQAAMLAYYLRHGFTDLHRTVEQLQAELARRYRRELAAEGWIA